MKWFEDPALFAEELSKHPSVSAMARAHGFSEAWMRTWRKRHGIAARPRSVPVYPVEVVAGVNPADALLLKALKKHGDSASMEALADETDLAPKRVRESLLRLGHDGYRVSETEDRVVLNRVPVPSGSVHKALFRGDVVRFGVISDTHLGSNHERLEELHMAYNVLRDEGITTVYHPGDLVCGIGIFPGQVTEIHKHTFTEQVDYAVTNYPEVPGITTHIIAGNHDIEGVFGKIGANPVIAVANQRPDIVFADNYSATFELEQGTRIELLHPKGGMSYAASYKLQKFAESFESGAKPHVMLVGHYHRRLAFEARGIQMVLAACFEGAGSFGKRLGLVEPAVGFHIIEMRVADDGSVVRFKPEWFKFWPGRSVEKVAA